MDSNVGPCANSHEEQIQQFKQPADKKLHGPRLSPVMKFMAHEIKYFNFHGQFMTTNNNMKFHDQAMTELSFHGVFMKYAWCFTVVHSSIIICPPFPEPGNIELSPNKCQQNR